MGSKEDDPWAKMQGAADDLSKGDNLVGSALTLGSFGLIGGGSKPPKAPSFEQRLAQLEQSGAFGGMSLAAYQNQNQARNTEGYRYSTEAAANAQQVLAGNVPSQAQIQFNQGLDNSIKSASSMAQSAPVDSALAYRSAMDAYNFHQAEAVRNAALLRAQEIAQARAQLGDIGGNLQNIYSNNTNNAIGAVSGVQASAAAAQQQSDLARYQASQAQLNALTGAVGAGVAAGMTGGASTAATAASNWGNTPNTQGVPLNASNSTPGAQNA